MQRAAHARVQGPWHVAWITARRVPDLAAVVGLCALACLSIWQLVRDGTVIGMDTATAFYPWYAYLGENLRSGHIPMWNPHQFAGTPFAGDPESGWAYLPAMLLFTTLPLTQAANAFLLFHVLLAGLATYALARSLAMPPLGAAASALAYTYSGFFFGHTVCCFAYSNVAAWLPVALLATVHATARSHPRQSLPAAQRGVEARAQGRDEAVAVQPGAEATAAQSRPIAISLPAVTMATGHRFQSHTTDLGPSLGEALARAARWWALGGLAIGQILAAWVGQGAYYALLFLGAFVVYRTLLASPAPLITRIKTLAVHGGALFTAGFGLAAIGLLPRFEFNALSNLPGGYGAAGLTSPTAALTDWGIIEDWSTRLLTPGFHYVGLVTLALALAAPVLVRGRHAAPFFATLSIAVLVLARWQPTPLHVALSILPGFGPMHVHAPERVLIVWFIGPALLAGATVGRIQAVGRSGVAAAALLTLCVMVDLRLAWQSQEADAVVASGAYELQQVDLAAYYTPTGGARFLQSATAIDRARAIGYAQHVFGGPIAYTLGWANPKTVALGVNNRGLLTGVDDIQGYNPLHLARYDAFMRELNGQTQNYHQTDVFEAGLGSPLLDLLGVRYIVLPVTPAADQVEPRLPRDLPTVYVDADVKVLENDQALPRAWVVHSAVQLDAQSALTQLATGAIDPRRTAALEKPPPPLLDSPPSAADQVTITQAAADQNAVARKTDEGATTATNDHAADQATVTAYTTDTVRVDVATSAPGLLILSDAYYPAWQARVDGSPVEVYAADGALRAVAVPAGKHSVEFQYASAALPVGAAVTGLTLLALAGCSVLRSNRARCR